MSDVERLEFFNRSSMSLVELRVELPAYANSFVIQVPRSCSIADVKQEIFRVCPGEPHVEGQRIIWRGRYLANHEKVDELWKSPDEPRIVHLAVHPSAWTSSPPEIFQPAQPFTAPVSVSSPVSEDESHTVPTQMTDRITSTTTANMAHPLAYVLFKHQNALTVLMGGSIVNMMASNQLEASRLLAVQTVERHGWSWPTVLDEEFPAATEGGLKYERVTIGGQAFLSLCNSGQPTALQAHALKILTYTFTLLSISNSSPNTTPTTSPQSVPIPPHINTLLQQLGLPQARAAPNQNPNPNAILPELREMPLRPLLAPLMMLIFRTLLLLYFVAPARKPIFGILILAWMLYEIWRPIRNGLIRGWQRAVQENQLPQNAPAREAHNPVAPGPERPPQNGPGGGGAAVHIDNQAAMVVNTLGDMNIAAEEEILNDTPGAATIEPGIGHKIITFLSLLFTTTHPAVWNRRRIALRRREGRIRTEANMRNTVPADTDGEEAQNETRAQLNMELRDQHARRPRWVRNYMERVVVGDWVDDSD